MDATTLPALQPHEAARLLQNGAAILIDVREPNEFQQAHIAQAASIPLSRIADDLDLSMVPLDRAIIFQCQKGARGDKACTLARKAGSGHTIYNLDGGIEAWQQARLPVVAAKQGTAALPIFRQVQIAVGLLVVLSVLAALISAMFALAGITGWCGLALLLARMPWNRTA